MGIANMNKISKQSAQSKAVENVLATLRIEKLMPDDYVVKGMKACVGGQKTTASLLQEVIRRHVPLRGA
jgi:hypothetical protein